MTTILTPELTAHWDEPDSFTLAAYRRGGGYKALPKALAMPPDEVISTLKESVLRGRGGAGFPTGVKWGFIPQGDGKPHYLVVNADESEPGACKDMPTLLANPQALIEGIVIASYAIRAHEAFIYVRGEVLHVIRRLHHAVAEAREAGFIGRDIPGSSPRSRPPRACTPAPRWSTTWNRSPPCPGSCSTAPRISPRSARRSRRDSGSSRSPGTSRPPASTRRRSARPCASCSGWQAASARGTG